MDDPQQLTTLNSKDPTKHLDRRRFMQRAGRMALGGLALRRSLGSQVEVSERKARLTIETDGPARLEVRGSGDEMYQPRDALMDRTVIKRPGVSPYYLGHFTSTGTAVLELPAGRYAVIAEKGLEFQRIESTVDLKSDQTVRLAPQRWAHMASNGWWSGDLHIHRPPEDAETLLLAEDLNFGVFFTMWNERNYWKDKSLPGNPTVRADATHIGTLMNAEDERGGGAWMMHNLKKPLALSGAERWYPQGGVFVQQAKAQGAWFDSEKPIWWEVPVMAATAHIDSLGVVHNHYNQYGMFANEAWGRPRDQELYPGNEGFSKYSQSLYHRYLNLGHLYPPTAGSASGVLPAPPGYNRVYVYAPDDLSTESFYSALRAGRVFSTNGPLLTFTVDGKPLGGTVEVSSGRPLQVTVEARAREPIDRVEVVANGRTVAGVAGSKLETEIEPKNYTWLAARCTLKTEFTIRFAHTNPIYLRGPRQSWDVADDKTYFTRWIDDLIEESEADRGRFANVDQKNEVLAIYKTAREHYLA
jgi:hypothetical protein